MQLPEPHPRFLWDRYVDPPVAKFLIYDILLCDETEDPRAGGAQSVS